MLRLFRHYIPLPMLWLLLVEAVVLLLSAWAGDLLRNLWQGDITPLAGGGWGRALVFTLVFLLSLTAFGLYKRTFRGGRERMLISLALGMMAGLGVMAMLFYFFPDLFQRRGAFAIAFVLAFLGLAAVRVLFFRLVGSDFFRRRVVVLGVEEGQRLFDRLRRRSDRLGFNVVAFIPLPDEAVEEGVAGVVRPAMPLLQYVTLEHIHEIVVVPGGENHPALLDDLLDCKMAGIEVVDMMTFIERHTGRIRIDKVTPQWLIYSDGFRRTWFQRYTKRAFDIAVSLVVLVAALPVMVAVAVAIKMEDGWRAPVFYRQARVGKNWALFRIIKFRSMALDAPPEPGWTEACDVRVTRVGRVIRRMRIDELPQVINVLKGEMNFVGPRPEQPRYVEALVRKIPYYAERHRVKPGITGWAQLHYPYGASERDALEKLQYDFYYIKNCSLFLDALILLQTAEVVLSGRGGR